MLRGKLMCAGCAVALVVGLVPVAAWATAEEGDGPSEVAALQTATNDKVEEITATGSVDATPTDDATAEGNPVIAEGDDAGNGAPTDPDGADGDETPNEGTGKADGTGTEGPDGDGDGDGAEDGADDQADPMDPANIADKNATPDTENDADEGGEDSDEAIDTEDETDGITYDDVEVISAGTYTFWTGEGRGVVGDSLFDLNDAGWDFFSDEPFADYVVSVTSSNPAVLAITQENNPSDPFALYYAEALKPGTATVTFTLKDKAPVSCTVTVKSYDEAQYQNLKFSKKTLTLTVGTSNWIGEFLQELVSESALASVNWSAGITSSDENILSVQANDRTTVAALRPGIATLSLYFYNPEKEEWTFTDTMKVTVTSPSAIAGTTPSSDIAGNIISSNGDLDVLVQDEGVRLDVKVKKDSELTAAQQRGLILVKDVTEADRAIPIDLSLIDQEGNLIHGGEEGYVFPYAVRLKLEGTLAELDPATIQVFYLSDEGRPENITSWVEGGYLYIVADHFSQYVVTGDLKAGTGATTAPTQQVGNKDASGSAKQTVTARATSVLPQAGDDAIGIIPAVALSAAAAGAALYLTRRRMTAEQ